MFTVRESEPVLTYEDGVPCVKTIREILPAIIEDKDLDELIKGMERGRTGLITLPLGGIRPAIFSDQIWSEDKETRRNLLTGYLSGYGIQVKDRPYGQAPYPEAPQTDPETERQKQVGTVFLAKMGADGGFRETVCEDWPELAKACGYGSDDDDSPIPSLSKEEEDELQGEIQEAMKQEEPKKTKKKK